MDYKKYLLWPKNHNNKDVKSPLCRKTMLLSDFFIFYTSIASWPIKYVIVSKYVDCSNFIQSEII